MSLPFVDEQAPLPLRSAVVVDGMVICSARLHSLVIDSVRRGPAFFAEWWSKARGVFLTGEA